MALVRDSFPNGECPDCSSPIDPAAEDGDACPDCGHVFWSELVTMMLAEDLPADESDR